MSADTNPSRSRLLMALGGLVIAWGIAGTIGAGDVPYSGYLTDGNNTITEVRAESPAAMAGLQTGDVITSIGGIAVTDARAATERGRPAIGETQAIIVDRAGAGTTVELTYAAVPTGQALVGHLGSLIGLSFLLFGFWAYRKEPNGTTRVLAWLGVCFGLAFMAAPYFTSAAVRTITGAIATVAVIAGFALLLDFLMRTGKDEAYTEAKLTPGLVYGPPLLVAAMLVGLTVFQPAATSRLNVVVRAIVGLFIVGYFGASLVQVVGNYIRADVTRRESRKLGMMLTGALVGLVPFTAVSIILLFSPTTVIPTSQYWFLTFVAIPITFAIAAVHGSQAGAPVQTAGTAPAAEPAQTTRAPGPPEEPATPPPDPDRFKARSVGGPDQVVEDATAEPPDSDDATE